MTERFNIEIEKGQFGWSIRGSWGKNKDCIMGTAPTIWGAIDIVTDYLATDLDHWSSYDANKMES